MKIKEYIITVSEEELLTIIFSLKKDKEDEHAQALFEKTNNGDNTRAIYEQD